MARPIQRIDRIPSDPQQERQDALGEILGALTENKEAVLTTLDLLGEIQRAGVLDLLQGMVKNRHEVGVIALHQLNQPPNLHLIRNIIGGIQFLGRLHPDQLNRWLNSLSTGLERSTELMDREEPESLWELGKWMRSREVRSSLTLLVRFLREMGSSMEQQPQSEQGESH
ncbi:DUF1641 domain-containing protein [Kroppenstedtia eburnea]|uniref:Uncharacterized conserved protein YjgD, DUF1641 family n=1 Tax=Kroppenstedtia eburnea TaxID=714067 RepID=A0A1N7KTK6_9BACL|nr:DUF1641 domain-containing protein [Kroppenstedtia eburnea]EGK12400.1 hypothetical protein HMPREF9374_1467 [Desmospora sp. 8437]QKI82821.1 DUF1641 domain-containing protein [Kroppenstedtia eburnea]SIS64881.1 Uncharacterized conserved protein YjgD, DUF1641 family [Kroppenstedtia eburnea]